MYRPRTLAVASVVGMLRDIACIGEGRSLPMGMFTVDMADTMIIIERDAAIINNNDETRSVSRQAKPPSFIIDI